MEDDACSVVHLGKEIPLAGGEDAIRQSFDGLEQHAIQSLAFFGPRGDGRVECGRSILDKKDRKVFTWYGHVTNTNLRAVLFAVATPNAEKGEIAILGTLLAKQCSSIYDMSPYCRKAALDLGIDGDDFLKMAEAFVS